MSEGKKRKRSYYQGKYGGKKSRYTSDLSPKMKGFIVTTSGKERSATLEAYRLLNEYADKKYGLEKVAKGDESDGDDGNEDIEAALKKQVTGIKEANKKGTERRFQSVTNKAKNVIFIKTDLSNPTELVTDIFTDLQTNGIQKTQHCQRLLPVVETCYAKMEHILAAARPLVQFNFHDSTESFSFSIKWKARCNSGLKREEVYNALVEMIWEVDKGHTTDYDHPEVVFNIDVIGNICCFGFLRNYNKYAKYNVEMVCKKVKDNNNDEKNSEEEKDCLKTTDKEIKEAVVEKTDDKALDEESKDGTQITSNVNEDDVLSSVSEKNEGKNVEKTVIDSKFTVNRIESKADGDANAVEKDNQAVEQEEHMKNEIISTIPDHPSGQ